MTGEPISGEPDSVIERWWDYALIAEFERCISPADGDRPAPALTPPIALIASLSLDLDPLIRLLAEVGVDLAMSCAVHVGEAIETATGIPPEGRCVVTTGVRVVKPTPRGSIIGLSAVARTTAGLLLWRKTSTVHVDVRLARRGRAPLTRLAVDAQVDGGATWTVAPGFPLEYSRFGDHNPLHLDDAVAHAAGFTRRPAHGLGVVAAAIAATGPTSPPEPSRMLHAAFRRPVLVDDTVQLAFGVAETGARQIRISTDADPEPAIVVVTGPGTVDGVAGCTRTEDIWTY